MRGLIQRVTEARVEVGEEIVGRIERGVLALIGVSRDDSDVDARWLARKIADLRIFEDDSGRLNHSLAEVNGAVLAVSQFTLYADAGKGRRPSFSRAANGEEAQQLYGLCLDELRLRGLPVATGRFGAHMRVALVNDGPVTIWLDSRGE